MLQFTLDYILFCGNQFDNINNCNSHKRLTYWTYDNNTRYFEFYLDREIVLSSVPSFKPFTAIAQNKSVSIGQLL